MVTLGSLSPLLAETVPVPPLPLAGRLYPTGTIVYLENSAAPPELTQWPEFHNAVAAGLRMLSINGNESSRRITRSWIQYARSNIVPPTMGANNQAGQKNNTVAGLFLALGLMRCLQTLTSFDILEHLTVGHEPLSVAILVGVAASKLGRLV
jgi:anaphase-promoting complex subunit 1